MTQVKESILSLKQNLSENGVILSKEGENFVFSMESLAETMNVTPLNHVALITMITECQLISKLINEKGFSPQDVVIKLKEELIQDAADDSYEEYGIYKDYLYKDSDTSFRGLVKREIVNVANYNSRKTANDLDIIQSILVVHENNNPAFDNDKWTDENLWTPYNTLSHLWGRYKIFLSINLYDIRVKMLKLDQKILLSKNANHWKNKALIQAQQTNFFNSEYNNKKREIETLIIENKIPEALEILMDFDLSFRNEAILLLSQLKEIRQKERLGIIPFREISISLIRIKSAILEILNEVK